MLDDIKQVELTENRLSDVLTSSDIWIWETDTKGTITYIDGPGKEFLGYPVKNLTGVAVFSLIESTLNKTLDISFLNNLTGKNISDKVQINYQHKSGTVVQMTLEVKPVYENHELKGFRGINKYSGYQESLLRQIEDIAKFPEENPNPILRISSNRQIIYTNTPGEYLLSYWKIKPGDNLPDDIYNLLIKNVLENNEPRETEIEIDSAIYLFSSVPVTKEGYVNIYASDITTRKQMEENLRINEQRYKLAQVAGNIGTWEWDRDKKIFYSSDMVSTIFKFQPGEFDGKFHSLWKKIYRKDRLKLITFLNSLKNKNDYATVDLRINDPDSGLKWVMLTGAIVLNPVSEQYQVAGTVQDITDRKIAEEKILTLSRGVEQSPALVMFTDPEGKIQYINKRFSEVMGYEIHEIRNQNTGIFNSGVHPKAFYDDLWKTLMAKKNWRGEICNKNKDGKFVWFLALISPVFDAGGDLIHYLYVSEDITEKKSREDKIIYQAHHDQLTGLSNRALFKDRLIQILETYKQINSQQLLAVLFIDLDKFKPVNDTLGHSAGDKVLKIIAQRLLNTLRKEDIIARLGGDEFGVIIQNLPSREQAVVLAEKILHSIEVPLEVENKVFHLSASIGISLYPHDGDNFNTLLIKADKAMYNMKRDPKTSIAFYSDEETL